MDDPQQERIQDPDSSGELVERGPFVIDHDPDREPDAEAVEVVPAAAGDPADPEPLQVTWADVTSIDGQRAPIVPAWLRSPQQRRAAARWAAGYAGYLVAFHAVRVPKYAGKTAWYAPVGGLRLTGRALRWASAEEGNWSLRQHAASRNDARTWLELDARRQRQAGWRWWVVLGGALVAAAAVAAVALLATAGVQVAVAAGVVLVLARYGRPLDRPILDRVTPTARFTRLTAEMVRSAVCAIGLPEVKDPTKLTFETEIHRDGPGFLARVNLPEGAEAVKAIERRGKLSSALRLPVDQVWPSAGPGHAGQLDLWVGYQPASKMGQPTWSLSSPTARTSVFEPAEFGTDERQRPISTVLFERNFLLGGAPGSGKSYAARCLALIAGLDPTCELKIAEFKGTGDFMDLADVCSTYVCGVDDAAFAAGADIITWGLAECQRRTKRIKAARQRGEAPHGKVTPELARRPGSGLHPVFILLDEVHELFGDAEHGPATAKRAERLIKQGRALNVIVVLATQIPDKDSVPPGITRCVTIRWCLAVQDQVANDMILGTGAYKRGLTATAYRPGDDAGWGIITGLRRPGPVRSFFPDPATTARIVARIVALRGGVVVGSGIDAAERHDLVDDVIRVWADTSRTRLQWDEIAAMLAEAEPEIYGAITAEAVSARLRGENVRVVDVKLPGKRTGRKGCERSAVLEVVARRALGSGS